MKREPVLYNIFSVESYDYLYNWLEEGKQKDLREAMGVEEEDEKEITETDIYEYINFCLELDWHQTKEVIESKECKHVLIGTIQTWTGTRQGSKDINKWDDLWSLFSDYDVVDVKENENGRVFINLYHHDGTHRLELREKTAKGYTKNARLFKGFVYR